MKLNSEKCNFADDNTLYSCGKDLNEIVTNLEIDPSRLFKVHFRAQHSRYSFSSQKLIALQTKWRVKQTEVEICQFREFSTQRKC